MPFPVPDPFVWDTSFQVFYFELDEKHRGIFQALFALGNDNNPSNLKLLYRVTANHFAEEEGFMQTANYGGYRSHKVLHEDFLAKLRSFKAPVPDKDVYFAKDWLVQHIKTIDFKYKNLL
uniref:Hemerythrin subunit A n=1 Tax=Sipunculus nudus TaxID=6446 RepID=HEMTA_SIPNU|nr:RecName: Full=Hemerythrin subunit A; Short=Hr A [Sipunculus nudus]CAF74912.1 hemerythrin subunit A [Sipunculus nudus]